MEGGNASSRRRAVIVGGGITGLTTAYRLLAAGAPFDVDVFESDDRLGGKISTVRDNGLVLDGGPDAFVTARPHAVDLCRELGIGDRLIETVESNRRVYIRRAGKLLLVPEGMVLTIPTRVLPLATSRLFSMRGVLRMGLDLVLPRGSGGDESIASFIERRLGREALERLAEPLLGGIYVGDPRELSMASTFPQLLELEKKHRSLVLGMLRTRPPRPSGPPPSAFMSLKTGMGDLVDALQRRIVELGGRIHLRTRVRTVSPDEQRYTVAVEDGTSRSESFQADALVLAAPLPVSAKLLGSIDAEASDLLKSVRHVSSATVLIAFRRSDIARPLDAVGVIVPKNEGTRAVALTFVTSKWEGRAPEDVVVLRVFFGGYAHESDASLEDAALVRLARYELRGILGIGAEPIKSRIFRFPSASPQPVVGHSERMKSMRERARAHPGLFVAGSAIDGTGIPDCIRQATQIAEAIRTHAS